MSLRGGHLLFPPKQSPVIRRLLRLSTRAPRSDIIHNENVSPLWLRSHRPDTCTVCQCGVLSRERGVLFGGLAQACSVTYQQNLSPSLFPYGTVSVFSRSSHNSRYLRFQSIKNLIAITAPAPSATQNEISRIFRSHTTGAARTPVNTLARAE